MRKDALLTGVLLALLLPIAGSLAEAEGAQSASSSPSASSAVYVESQQQPTRLTIKPHSYYSHVSAHNLVWTNWGQATTTAQGTFTFQFCVEESCSVSPFYDDPVVVTLGAVKRCGPRLSYTALQLEVSGATLPDTSFKKYQTNLGCPKRPADGRRKHG